MSDRCPNCGHHLAAREPKPREPLTDRQAEVLAFVRESIERRGCAPTHEEIARALGLSSIATVNAHLGALEDKRYIRRRFNRRQAITILDEPTHG